MGKRQEKGPAKLFIYRINTCRCFQQRTAHIWDGMDGYMIEELLIKIISMEKAKLLNVLVM